MINLSLQLAMSLHATGAVLGGASTLPAARGTGAQPALLAHRLSLAADRGVSLVTATAAPASECIAESKGHCTESRLPRRHLEREPDHYGVPCHCILRVVVSVH